MADSPAVSVIIGTCRRPHLLEPALQSLIPPRASDVPFEVIVVDNGGSDDTREVVDRLAGRGPFRYLVEPRRGVSFARNAGARAARAPVLAFMDDDQQAAHDWVRVIHRTFMHRPGIDFIGGRVWPLWTCAPPPWAASARGPLSMIDRGDQQQPIDACHWICLPGGNMACRRRVLEAVGGWADYPRSQDRELTVRLLLAGRTGLYVPELLMYHRVDAARVTRAHFRRWHVLEGRMRAAYRFAELFSPDGRIGPPRGGRRLAGVPLFVYRELLTEACRAVRFAVRREFIRAFTHELQARYLLSYITARARLAAHP